MKQRYQETKDEILFKSPKLLCLKGQVLFIIAVTTLAISSSKLEQRIEGILVKKSKASTILLIYQLYLRQIV